MADAGLNAVNKVILAALNVAGVTSLVATSSHFSIGVVPPGSSYPAITWHLVSSDQAGLAFSGDAESYLIAIKGVTKGSYSLTTAIDIAEAIDTVLNRQTLAPTGYVGIYGILRQHWIPPFIQEGPDRIPFGHAGGVYRMWAERT